MKHLLLSALLIIPATALAQPACTAPDTGIEVARTAPAEWHICQRTPTGHEVAWVITGEHNPGPGSRPTAVGQDLAGLREAWWNGIKVVECGNCDLIESVRLDATTPLVWNGRAYGMGGDPMGVVTALDGQLFDQPIGTTAHGETWYLSQVGLGYVPTEAIAYDSARIPATERHTTHTVNAQGMHFTAEVLAVHAHELAMVYHARLAALTTCTGGPIDGYTTETGTTWAIGACAGTSNVYTYPQGEPWIELTSTAHPGLGLLLTNADPQPWRVIHNIAYDAKLKPYGIPVNSYASPAPVALGDRRTYAHSVAFR